MHTLIVEKINKIKKAVPKVESKLKIKISFSGKKLTLKGNELTEFITIEIIKAIDYGFDTEDALLLLDQNYSLKIINIKEHTRRKNLEEIRARIIGRQGKAKTTIANLTNSKIVVKGNEVAIISDADHLEFVTQGVISLIQGAKHGNVFSYLEKQNRTLREIDKEDLGLKGKFKMINIDE